MNQLGIEDEAKFTGDTDSLERINMDFFNNDCDIYFTMGFIILKKKYLTITVINRE